MVVRRDQNALKLLQDSGIVPPGSPTRGPIVDRIAHACHDGTPAIEQGPILAVSLDVSHKGLGITIAGGIGNEHIPGDHSIFITSVFPNGSAYGYRVRQTGSSSDILLCVAEPVYVIDY